MRNRSQHRLPWSSPRQDSEQGPLLPAGRHAIAEAIEFGSRKDRIQRDRLNSDSDERQQRDADQHLFPSSSATNYSSWMALITPSLGGLNLLNPCFHHRYEKPDSALATHFDQPFQNC